LIVKLNLIVHIRIA